MTPLHHIYFAAPVTLHGRVVREVTREAPFPKADGTISLGWELHLHPDWGCVVVTSHDDDAPVRALVPLVRVASMVLYEAPTLAVVPDSTEGTGRRGRPRTKRLGLATDTP